MILTPKCLKCKYSKSAFPSLQMITTILSAERCLNVLENPMKRIIQNGVALSHWHLFERETHKNTTHRACA